MDQDIRNLLMRFDNFAKKTGDDEKPGSWVTWSYRLKKGLTEACSRNDYYCKLSERVLHETKLHLRDAIEETRKNKAESVEREKIVQDEFTRLRARLDICRDLGLRISVIAKS